MADAVLGDAVPVSPDIGSSFKLPGADNEPAAAHVFAYTVNVEATDNKPVCTDPRPPSALEDDGSC